MSEREDIEALAVYLAKAQIEPHLRDWPRLSRIEQERLLNHARVILDSDWLAVHDELVRADERVRLAGEVASLTAEVAHWKDHAEEAGRGFARVCRDYARVSARNVDLAARLPVPGVRLTEEA